MNRETFLAARAARAAVLGLGSNDDIYFYGEGDPSDADIVKLAVTLALAAKALSVSPPERCNGSGYNWHFDCDYPCGGCLKCRPAGGPAWYVGAALWKLAHSEAHAALAVALDGFAALAAIGRAVANAGAVGASVALFVGGAVAEWNTVRKGRWYKVTGKRGKAKEFFGLVGECTWMGEVESGRPRPIGWRGSWNTTTTLRAGIAREGFDKPAYVPASCLSPVETPAAAKVVKAAKELELARKAVRPAFAGRVGKRGDTGLIVEGKFAGKSGKVFWKSPDGKRVGVDIGASEPAWCSANDVVAVAARFNPGNSFEERDAALAGAEACMLALAAAGFDKAAEKYGALAKSLG